MEIEEFGNFKNVHLTTEVNCHYSVIDTLRILFNTFFTSSNTISFGTLARKLQMLLFELTYSLEVQHISATSRIYRWWYDDAQEYSFDCVSTIVITLGNGIKITLKIRNENVGSIKSIKGIIFNRMNKKNWPHSKDSFKYIQRQEVYKCDKKFYLDTNISNTTNCLFTIEISKSKISFLDRFKRKVERKIPRVTKAIFI